MEQHRLARREELTPFELKVRRGVKRGQPIRVVEISYTPCPDADDRLQKALAVLLRAAARAQKQGVAQDSAPAQNGEQEGNNAE